MMRTVGATTVIMKLNVNWYDYGARFIDSLIIGLSLKTYIIPINFS